jgi:hypothetical protein
MPGGEHGQLAVVLAFGDTPNPGAFGDTPNPGVTGGHRGHVADDEGVVTTIEAQPGVGP